ncbi:FMN-binding domain protein [Alkaliphilus metalliredigens QYMF]|uniref:Ion-translocating oxidoreductase complex subunit G n=1 Tax=Alkaliphilus metalliredigens (strain QYMF) TaxID=293826 RepID=A6TT07_ALKMQ|nr:FMN-binding protein [Alkaliphilus metalliredigens]ABR49325.1 FMN-binding domain protein [Alkaliphilus metalliredigens QYMF]
MKKFTFKPILFMIILTVVYTGVLATINEVTRDRIQLNEKLSEQRSLLYVLDFSIPDDAVEVSNFYSTHIEIIEHQGETLYAGYQGDELVGYVIPIVGDAVWGQLTGFVALTPDFTEIIGVEFLSHNETPGLGGRIDELEFKEQFRSIGIDPDAIENFIAYRPDPEGQVDAISGATGTSNAVRRILNASLQAFLAETREGL